MKKLFLKLENKTIYKILFLIGTLIIFMYNLRHFEYLLTPTILLDEFGYWATGATIAGKDWSGIASTLCPYYSYGFGLLLAIIISFAKNILAAYQIAIIVNSIMVTSCFYIAYYVFAKSFPKIDKIFVILGSFLIQFYPNVIYQTQIVWAEIPLMFVFWLSILVLQSILECPKIYKLTTFSILLFYLYMIHQRSLGVLAVGIIVICYLAVIKKIKIKEFLAFCITIIFMFFLHLYLKNYIYADLWNNTSLNIYAKGSEQNNLLGLNDFQGQLIKIKQLFSLEGIRLFLISFFGKLFYMGIATLFLGFEGIRELLLSASRVILDLFSKSKKTIENKNILDLYLFGSFITTLLISTIFMLNPSRIDTVMYGRYTDFLLGPIILYGFLNLFKSPKLKKNFIIYSIFILTYSICFKKIIEEFQLYAYFDSCAPIGRFFAQFDAGSNLWILIMPCMMLLVALWLLILVSQKGDVFRHVTIFISIFLIWIIITQPAIKGGWELSKTEVWMKLTQELLDNRKSDEPIYYIYDVEDARWGNLYIGSIQFLLEDISISCASKEKLEEIPNDALIISPVQYNMKNSKMDNYQVLHENDYYVVYKN